MDEKIEQKMTALLGEYQAALKWTRDKLKEKEEECERLQFIIIHMTESEERKEAAYDFDP